SRPPTRRRERRGGARLSSRPMTNLERPLARGRSSSSMRGLALKVAGALAGVALLAALVSRIDLKHDLHRMHVRVLSGEAAGNYHAVVASLATTAARGHGVVTNVASHGSADNMHR